MIDAPSRRNDNRSKIIDAASRLLQEQGPSAVTTRAVAEAAGVQAPAIYRLFGDKDGLLDAVAEHVMSTYVSAKAAHVLSASAENVDPLDDLRAGWKMQIDFGLANPALFRLFSEPGRGTNSLAVQAGRRVLESRVHRVAAIGRLRVSEEHAATALHASGVGTVQALLESPPEQRDLSLITTMYEAVLRQILTDVPEPAENGPLSATVAFRAVAPQLDMLTDAERHLLSEWLDRAVTGLTPR